MRKIRRSPEDRRFSLLIRERDGFRCQRCGNQFTRSDVGLHSAHCFGRAMYNTRHDPENAVALCYGCHSYLDTHPDEKEAFFRERLGQERFEALRLRAHQSRRVIRPKRASA